MTKLLQLCATILVILASGCSTSKFDDKYYDVPEKKLFDMMQTEVAHDRYPEAAEMFESFDSQYPTSKYSEQALTEYIYSQYRMEEHALAAAAAERFLTLYPRSKKADYVLYLKGVINSDQERSLFDSLFQEDLSTRDSTYFKKAYQDFDTLVKRYPNSPYAGDARHRMVFLRNLFAQHELNIAKFYLKRELLVAAVNRAINVVESYPQSPQVLDALEIIIDANKKMDFKDSMRDAVRIVKMNFPNAKVLKEI